MNNLILKKYYEADTVNILSLQLKKLVHREIKQLSQGSVWILKQLLYSRVFQLNNYTILFLLSFFFMCIFPGWKYNPGCSVDSAEAYPLHHQGIFYMVSFKELMEGEREMRVGKEDKEDERKERRRKYK